MERVCVREREADREGEKKKQSDRQTERLTINYWEEIRQSDGGGGRGRALLLVWRSLV